MRIVGRHPHERPARARIVTASAIAAIAALLLGIATRQLSADPSALWHIVHDRCVPHQSQVQDPAPCAAVLATEGSAVLKDSNGDYQFLLIPTARVSGIEDPAILAADAPNYWDAAWQARRFLEQRVGHSVPRDMLALAINAPSARSQDQLHIHIDCLRPDVRDALHAHKASVGRSWADFPVPLAGHRYRALLLSQSEMGATNPFRLLAAEVGAAAMARHTLVLVGAEFPDIGPGFILLDGAVDVASGDLAHGEALQDHSCALLH